MSSRLLKQELVYYCLVKRYSENQIQKYIQDKTNKKISTKTIERIKKNLRNDSRKYFFTLAKDNDEAYLELKLRIDSTKILINKLWDDFENAKGNFITRVRIADQITKEENQIQEWYSLLNYEHGNGYITNQETKEYSETF